MSPEFRKQLFIKYYTISKDSDYKDLPLCVDAVLRPINELVSFRNRNRGSGAVYESAAQVRHHAKQSTDGVPRRPRARF